MPITLDDLINDLDEWLQEVDDTLESEPEPLPEPVKAAIEAQLHAVSDVIDWILDPNVPPNLPPDCIGSTDSGISAITPKQYAEITLRLADEAKSEMDSGNPDYAVVRRCLCTIKYLLPGFEQSILVAV